MATVEAPGSHDASRGAAHGRKRAGDNTLESEQRLSKRFNLLNIVDGNGMRLYTPVSASPQPHPLTTEPGSRAPSDDAMHVEDTPHRIYIADLAAELSDIPSDDNHPIFLSDVDRHISKIPAHILQSPAPKPTEHNQLVLYNEPASLTVPVEQDSVRKAIVEARQRIREKQGSAPAEVQTPRAIRHEVIPQMDDEYDAMDID